MQLPSGSLVLGPLASAERVLVFVPGFMASPGWYRALLTPVAASGVGVVVPRLVRPGPRALAGRVPAAQEGDRLVAVVTALGSSGVRVWVGGHSRGGLVAWSAADRVDAERLLLVDPVTGDGPPWRPAPPLPVRTCRRPPLVVGLGAGGRCAPPERGHRVFAAAAPGCEHTVVPGAGHADVLDGRAARVGGLLCSRGVDPAGARRTVTDLLRSSLD